MGVMNINVEIISANNVGGVYPFVVACFDNDLSNEVHKTPATTGGSKAIWDTDNSFSLDLTTAVKNLKADGKPEPTYLTFFLFDTGTPGVPSLGSSGVLLATVRDKGIAKGDFPIVNGNGSLTLIVSAEKGRQGGWFQSDGAKLAAGVGAVGLGALAAGFTAMTVNKHRDKKKRAEAEGEAGAAEEGDPNDASVEHPDDPSAGSLPPPPAPPQGPHQSAMPPPAAYPPQAAGQPEGYPAQQGTASRMLPPQQDHALPPSAAGPQGARPWWDPSTSESDNEEDPNSTPAPPQGSAPAYPSGGAGPPQQSPYGGPPPPQRNVYAQQPYEGYGGPQDGYPGEPGGYEDGYDEGPQAQHGRIPAHGE